MPPPAANHPALLPAPLPTLQQGAFLTARGVVAHDGVRGLYRGFGTVVGGMFPARMVRVAVRVLVGWRQGAL